MTTAAEHTYDVATALRAQLAERVGAEAWPTVAAELARLDTAWAAAIDDRMRQRLAADYRDALAPWPAAYALLHQHEREATLYEAVLTSAAALAEQLGDGQGAARLREVAGRRYITGLKAGQKAHSLKLGNIAFDLPNVAAAAGSVLTTIAALVASDAQPIALAGAVLLLIAGLAKPFVREIDADDASVFLGLARAAGPGREAALADIVAAANAARHEGRLRLGVLTEAEALRSLSVLSQMGSVAPVEGEGERWRVMEEHGAVA